MKNIISFREFAEKNNLQLTDWQMKLGEQVMGDYEATFNATHKPRQLVVQQAIIDYCQEYRIPFKINPSPYDNRCCKCGHVIKDDTNWLTL